MKMPNFHKADIFPPLTSEDRERKAIHIRDTIKHFASMIPSETPVQSVTLVPEMSITFLEIVNNLRDCDLSCLAKVWEKCHDETTRFVYQFCNKTSRFLAGLMLYVFTFCLS